MNADWTTGPAKWAAVVVLGAASIFGIGWSVLGRVPLAEHAPVAPAPTTAPPPAQPKSPGLQKLDAPAEPVPAVSGIMDLNTASEAQLELLPSIGPALARRIVEYRDAHGRFKTIDELDSVSGIGPVILEKLRPLVTVR